MLDRAPLAILLVSLFAGGLWLVTNTRRLAPLTGRILAILHRRLIPRKSCRLSDPDSPAGSGSPAVPRGDPNRRHPVESGSRLSDNSRWRHRDVESSSTHQCRRDGCTTSTGRRLPQRSGNSRTRLRPHRGDEPGLAVRSAVPRGPLLPERHDQSGSILAAPLYTGFLAPARSAAHGWALRATRGRRRSAQADRLVSPRLRTASSPLAGAASSATHDRHQPSPRSRRKSDRDQQ